MTLFSGKPHAQIAHTSSRGIDGVDGAPATHTAPSPTSDRKVSSSIPGPAPHSFAAIPPVSRRALVPWWSLLLSLLALATLGALTAIAELPALIGATCAVGLAGCCLVLVLAELVHRTGNLRDRH